MDNSLEKMREYLSQINESFFDQLTMRSNLVEKIAGFKKNSSIDAWDPKQELNVFKTYVARNDEKYDVLYSQLIEVQAKEYCDYPSWSDGAHLREKSGEITDFVNPVLLFVRNKSVYENLKLRTEFKSKLEGILNE